MKRRLLIAAIATAFASQAAAEDMLQVYRDARAYDAQYSAARYALQAGIEKLPQGLAGVLPTLNLTGYATRANYDVEPRSGNTSSAYTRSISNANYTFTLTQPVYRAQNKLTWDQGEYQVKQAEALFSVATQDLILRVAQAYFDVLSAQDTLALTRAQKEAISEQLAQAKRNFEVGTATITDTHEAQARFDLSSAQEITALNDLEVKRRNLAQITGKNYEVLKPLKPEIKLSPPAPAKMESWVELATKQSFTVLAQEAVAEIAQLEAKKQRAGHYPTLDLVASYGLTGQTGSTITSLGTNTTASSLQLQVAVPLYAGGVINSRERETAALAMKARDDLENVRRTSALTSQQSYLGVINGIAQVRALEAALVSSQSALDSNKLGYEVGVRINIDVLNAQQQLFSTRRDLAVARYNTITNFLKLKAAVGGLAEPDLEEYNKALAP
jgi:outer membrane protein